MHTWHIVQCDLYPVSGHQRLKIDMYLFEACRQNMKCLLQVFFIQLQVKKVARLGNFGYFCSKKNRYEKEIR